MFGEPLGQHGAHRLLGGAVGDRDRAVIWLEVGGHASAEMRAYHGPGDIGGRFGGGDQAIHRLQRGYSRT